MSQKIQKFGFPKACQGISLAGGWYEYRSYFIFTGHEQLQTTMVYLDITTEDSAKALATLENENDRKVTPKWKNADGSLVNFCGLRNKKN